METVPLDQGLSRTVAPNGLTVLTELLARGAFGRRRGLGPGRQRARAARQDGRLPPARAHGVQGHRAAERPAARPRARSPGRVPRRLHQPRSHQLPGPRPRRGPAPGAGCPDRPGPPPAAPRGATSTWSATWCWRRSPPSRTRPTTWSSSCSANGSGPTIPTATRSSAPGTPSARSAPAISRRCTGRATTAATAWSPRRAASSITEVLELLERRAGSTAERRAAPCRQSAPAPAVARAEHPRRAGLGPDPPGLRLRHLPLPGSPALRSLDRHQRVRGRDVEPAVPADPGRAGAGLRRLRLPAVLPVGRGRRRLRRDPAGDRRRRPRRRSARSIGRLAREGLSGRGTGDRASSSSRGR